MYPNYFQPNFIIWDDLLCFGFNICNPKKENSDRIETSKSQLLSIT